MSIQSTYKVKDIQIVDISGKEVMQKQINNYMADIDIKTLSSGSYVIKINTDKGTAVKQVVIE